MAQSHKEGDKFKVVVVPSPAPEQAILLVQLKGMV